MLDNFSKIDYYYYYSYVDMPLLLYSQELRMCIIYHCLIQFLQLYGRLQVSEVIGLRRCHISL